MAILRHIMKIFSPRYRAHALHEDVTEFFDQLSILLSNNVTAGWVVKSTYEHGCPPVT